MNSSWRVVEASCSGTLSLEHGSDRQMHVERQRVECHAVPQVSAQVVILNCTTHETSHHAALREVERLHMILVPHGDSTQARR